MDAPLGSVHKLRNAPNGWGGQEVRVTRPVEGASVTLRNGWVGQQGGVTWPRRSSLRSSAMASHRLMKRKIARSNHWYVLVF